MAEDLKSLQNRIKALEAQLKLGTNFTVIPETKRDDKAFKNALAKLSSDKDYRNKATADPSILSNDFKLTILQLKSLREVAVMSGADVSKVEALQATVIGGLIKRPGGLSANWDVSCCSCCCCCCGETSVQTMMYA
jgi:hypothetical protein